MRTFAQKSKDAKQTRSAKSTKPNRALSGQSRAVHSILHLQRTIGNQAVQRLLQSNAEELQAGAASTASTRFSHDFSRIPIFSPSPIQVQPKLTINTPGDIYEQEADRVADQVMRMPEPRLQRVCACGGKCPKCGKEEGRHEQLRTKPFQTIGTQGTEVPSSVYKVLHSPSQPMDPTTRTFYELRFGRDFSKVRVHTDSRASQSAKTINAKAYTFKNQIIFGTNRYQPQTSAGRQLLAHELTHVVQQGGAAVQQKSLPTNDDVGLETATNAPAGDVRRPLRQEASAHIQSLNRPGIKASVPDGNSSVQRVADKSNPPSNMPCDRVDTGPGGPGGTHVIFGQAGQTLDQADRELIAAEFRAWDSRGRIDTITVHGFASSEGSSGINWRLSCNRAEIVKAELMRLGIPANMVVTIAHGETEEFSPTGFPPNRRSVIRVAPAAQPGPTQECPTPITDNTTLTTVCTNGIVIAADNVILDCAGHTLTGSGGGSGVLLNRRTGVRVVNCRVTNFRNGFGLRNSTRNTFTNNTAFVNSADGFDLNDSPNNTFIQNVANNNPDHGFEFDLSGENLLVGNTANENGDGFDASGINRRDSAPSPNNTFVNNTANSNRESGFRISSDGNTLRGNTANNSVGVPDNRRGAQPGDLRRGDGVRIEGNDNALSGNSGSGNRGDDLDVRNNTTGNSCSGNTFGTTNGQCPPDFP